MPQAEWNEKTMRHTLAFFPLVGAAVGAGVLQYFQLPLPGGMGGQGIHGVAVPVQILPLRRRRKCGILEKILKKGGVL